MTSSPSELTAPRSILLEVCTASLEDCLTAQEGGADRVELNSALELGGLTPSVATLRAAARRLRIPIIAMARPRPGGFFYSELEESVMMRDAEWCLAEGADGIAFGFLNPDGSIDVGRTTRMVRLCGTREAVFHRAFDLSADPPEALETLIDCGVTRVLTSGGRPTAALGAPLLADLVRRAAGRIEILPGSGIRPDNVRALLRETGAGQVHASLSARTVDPSERVRPEIAFGSGDEPHGYRATDGAAVRAMRDALDRQTS